MLVIFVRIVQALETPEKYGKPDGKVSEDLIAQDHLSRLQNQIKEYGIEGNVDEGNTAHVFRNPEEVLKVIPQSNPQVENEISNPDIVAENFSILEDLEVATPTKYCYQVYIPRGNIGKSIFQVQERVEDYNDFLEKPHDNYINPVLELAEKMVESDYALDFKIQNIGIRNGKAMVLDDADKRTIRKAEGPGMMGVWLSHSLDALDETYADLEELAETVLYNETHEIFL